MKSIRKQIEGVVVGNSMDKTIVVKNIRKVKHPLYGKFINKSKKYFAHDKDNKVKVGQTVLIEETRPISKNKCWKLLKVLNK